MNHYEDPAVYGLTGPDGGVFYVGRTKINAKNRWWQHLSRARSGHEAPVYVWMREVGVENVGWTVLQHLNEEDDAPEVEAAWIARLVTEGRNIVNSTGLDGRPNSWSEEMRRQIGDRNRGKPTWIKGKTGEEAGWTEERRRATAEARRQGRIQQHGTRTERKKYGCQCEDCLTWEAGYYAAIENKKTKNQHGTVAGYKHGKCRCDDCRAAYREYQKRFKK